jgi:hypothetical protein
MSILSTYERFTNDGRLRSLVKIVPSLPIACDEEGLLMTTKHPLYTAYLLRTWQEERVEGSSAPTCYYLIEQLFGARQRWLFTDAAECHQHLQNILSPSFLSDHEKIDV